MKNLFRLLLVLILVAAGAVAYIWFSRPADVVFDAVRNEVPHAAFSRFADLDGLRVHYQEKGSGPALILIHGYTSLAYTWKDVFDEFAKSYHTIAIDLKGHGFTGKPDGDYTMPAQAALVTKLMDHLKIDQAILCGNSMGGAVSLMTAINYPQKVKGLILVDSAGIVNTGAHKPLTDDVIKWPVLGPAFAALALTSDSIVRDGMKRAYVDPAMITEERVAAYWRPVKTRSGQQAMILVKRQWDMSPIEQSLGKVHQPALLIWGAEDQIIPLDTGKKMNSLITGSQMLVFDKCGHSPQEEMPERFAREALNFAAHLTAPASNPAALTATAKPGGFQP